MSWLDESILAGDHFLVKLAIPEKTESGLVIPDSTRDYRKKRDKPDAYAGIVLDVSPGCDWAKIGDNVVYERWSWQQFSLDSERMIARERDLIIINEQPVNGYIIFDLEDLSPIKANIALPQTLERPKPQVLSGKVVASGVRDINSGENYIFQRMDSYQFHYGDGRMAFRVNKGADILASYEKVPVLEVV